jgi:hypothetical protein
MLPGTVAYQVQLCGQFLVVVGADDSLAVLPQNPRRAIDVLAGTKLVRYGYIILGCFMS